MQTIESYLKLALCAVAVLLLSNADKPTAHEATLFMEKPVLIERLPNKPYERVRGVFLCHCGNKFEARINNINTGQIRSCGCFKKQVQQIKAQKLTVHGLKNKNKRLYSLWKGVRARCNNPNSDHYYLYGGRGIKICDEWNNYANFYNWAITNGYENGLSIERSDNNQIYCPGNCTWIPVNKQSQNRRCTMGVAKANEIKERIANGERNCDIAKEFGVSELSISRLRGNKTYKT